MTDPYVPPAVHGHRPFWARPFAPVRARIAIAYLSAILLALSTWYGISTLFLYRYDPRKLPNGDDKPDWDNFKYGQEVSSKIWLALVTALTILYFGKDIRG